MGDLGLFGLVVPEEYGGAGGDFTRLCVAIEELGRVDQSIGITLVGRRRPGHQPDPDVRHRGAEGALAARPRRRPGAGRVRPDRARGRLRRRRDPDPGRARRRRVGHQRRQGVHHQLRHRRSPPSSRSPRAPGRGRRRPEITAILVPAGTPGLHRRAGLRQARLAHLGHPRADLRRLPGAGGQPARRSAAAGFQQFLAILDDGRIAISALAVGLAQACLDAVARLRQDAAAVRRADRRQPGRRLPDRRPRGRGRGGAAADLQGGLAARTDAAGRRGRRGQAGRRDRQAVLDRGRGRRRPASPPRSSAATASWRSTRSPGSTATPRSSRSARGRREVQRMVIARGLGLPVA